MNRYFNRRSFAFDDKMATVDVILKQGSGGIGIMRYACSTLSPALSRRKRVGTRLSRRIGLVALLAAVLLFVAGCAVTLVQPYDEKLLTDTEAIFKKASAMIYAGVSASPRTDEERKQLKILASAPNSPQPLTDHPAHVSHFETRYNELAIDADALILRAVSKAQDVGPLGNKLQQGIEQLIQQNLPSACADLETEFGAMTSSLTVMNYVDLKCLFIRWRDQHGDPKLTDGTGILKKTNWELRRSTIFAAVLAIEQAETSRKK